MNIDPEVFGDALGELIREAIETHLAPVLKRIDSLEVRGLKYCGTWQRAMDYGRGDVITYAGAAWIVVSKEVRGIPGEDPGWQLFVKAGKDGKDAR